MADKRKADANDVTRPGGQPRPRVARRETTAGTSAPTSDGPDISQAPEEPTATAAGDSQPLPAASDAGLPDASSLLGGALGRGGGSPSHSSAPPTPVIQSPPRNPGGGSAPTGHGSVSSGQNQITSPRQAGTGQPLPHGDSGGHSGQPSSAAPEQQSSSGASAPSPVSGDAGASDQQYRAGLGKVHAGLQKSERILDRPISIRGSEQAPKWRSSSRTGVPVVRPRATAPSPVPAPPPRVLWESLLPQELQDDLEELNEEVEEVTTILTQICKACGRLSGSNDACSVCRRG